MTTQLTPAPILRVYDNSGNLAVGGLVYTYIAGTTTPVATYTDSTGSTPQANPIVLNSRGEASIWLTPGQAYKYVVYDAAGNLLWTEDQITNVSLSASSGASSIGYTQGGTGSITTNVAVRLGQFVDVHLDFGAVDDGATNYTTAFTNATALGVPVYVPKNGTYYVVTALTNSQKELLWGPGVVQVAGVQIQLQSSPVIQNNGGTIPNSGGAVISAVRNSLAPVNQLGSIAGNVGSGMISTIATRTGGAGLYGNWVNTLVISAATPSPQFDVGTTAWVTQQNLTGGAVYGMWPGCNTPASTLSQTFSGGSAIAMEANVGNRWADFGAQLDVGGAQYTVGIQVVPDVVPSPDGVNNYTVSSITIASPAVITTTTAHGLKSGCGVVFGGAGTLPTGITAGTNYFVLAAGLTATSFQISATTGGAAVNTSGSFAAPITALPSYPGSFGFGVFPSVHGHKWWVGHLMRTDTLMPDNGSAIGAANSYGILHYGGSAAANAPRAWALISNFWTWGLDFSGATFAQAPLNFSFSNQTSTTATAGSTASPGNYQGFIKMAVGGTIVKVPYFQN